MEPLNLDQMEARAALCLEATIPGDQLRELIRLARIGQEVENQHTRRGFGLRLVPPLGD